MYCTVAMSTGAFRCTFRFYCNFCMIIMCIYTDFRGGCCEPRSRLVDCDPPHLVCGVNVCCKITLFSDHESSFKKIHVF